jgi:hypothetical protein
MEKEPRHSRENLRPLAVRLLEAHRQIAQSGDVDEVLMDRIKEAHATIMAMCPDLVDKYLRTDVVADLTEATSDIGRPPEPSGDPALRIPHCGSTAFPAHSACGQRAA